MKFYQTNHDFEPLTRQYLTTILMHDGGTFDAAQAFERPCCLNFASHKRPGGGYKGVMAKRGPNQFCKTQEEDLFRKSNLPELMDVHEIRQFYPLSGLQGFYTDGVIVRKDDRLNDIKPFEVSIITLPALVRPSDDQYGLVAKKIRRILDIAADNQARHLILGAWGCGVFCNDPTFVSREFCNLLATMYDGIFETVVFAIPGKTSENYRIFEASIAEKNFSKKS